ncbi:MAG TPA: sigma-70 family RNA polymerase sigma factor [Vicinamibacterales bacterium]|nr:sigma-70 family RNA polymerase sigma factor [Vicinamibacterales bacterium]
MSDAQPEGDGRRADLERRFSALFAQYGASVARLAASYTHNSTEREDLFQDIAMAIWQALPRFRQECSDRTFLFRIAHNRGISYVSRRRLPVAAIVDEMDVPDMRTDPVAALVNQQEGEQLLDAIRRLPVSYRQIITLTLEDLSYADIAEVVGISEGNVGVRLTRARQLLRQLLQVQK